MPYTPPKPRSPVISNKSTPALSRNQSYDQSPQSSRPDLPRSRSAVYIQKHRRSPALGDPNTSQQNGVENSKSPVSFADGSSTVASAQLSAAGKPLLADSFNQSPVDMGSSDEDERGRSRKIADLAESLKSSSLSIGKRQHSPRREDEGNNPSAPHQTPATHAIDSLGASLTPQARKIAHSRSTSEMIPLPSSQYLTVDTAFSPEDSDSEDGLMMRRMPLLRKKSGELVKPALRPSRSSSRKRIQSMSAPGTPSYPKAVHFNENIAQVRHFLTAERPSAVSADSSPTGEVYDSEPEYPFIAEPAPKSRPGVEWEIKTNFSLDSHERMCQPVRLEQISLSKDMKSLEGVAAVANIAFDKWVTARFTFDYWKTTSEVAAQWSDVRYKNHTDGFDRFAFNIRLSDQSHLQNKTLLLCIRFNSGGQEHWDSNGGQNYQVDFTRKMPQWTDANASKGNAGIPRSRNSNKTSSITRPRSFPVGNSDDEFNTNFESPFRLKGRSMLERSQSAHDAGAQHHATGPRFANRYDFNTSLHTALLTAQTALGDKSGLGPKRTPAPTAAPAQAAPAASGGARPVIGSVEYKALLDRFCYFGSPANNSAIVSPHGEAEEPNGLGIVEADGNSSSESKDSSANSSASHSPPSPKVQLHQPQAVADSKTSTRNSSPSVRALSSPHLLPYRSPSPALNTTSAYQEFSHQGLSIQSTKC